MNRSKNVLYWMKQMMLTEFYFSEMICSSKEARKSQCMSLQYPTYCNIMIISYCDLGIVVISRHGEILTPSTDPCRNHTIIIALCFSMKMRIMV